MIPLKLQKRLAQLERARARLKVTTLVICSPGRPDVEIPMLALGRAKYPRTGPGRIQTPLVTGRGE